MVIWVLSLIFINYVLSQYLKCKNSVLIFAFFIILHIYMYISLSLKAAISDIPDFIFEVDKTY